MPPSYLRVRSPRGIVNSFTRQEETIVVFMFKKFLPDRSGRGQRWLLGAGFAALASWGGMAARVQSIGEMAQSPNVWVMPAGNFSNCRYSQLDRINTSNAKYLRPAWNMPIGRLRGHERQPLVMYLMTLNAKSGAMEWKFQNGDPKLGQTVTAATQVFKDIVMVGISGDEPGTATNGRSVPRRAGHSYAPYGTSSLGREHQPSDRVERA